MKRKKSFLMLLICILVLSISALPCIANAQTINATSQKITDTRQAIKLIEQNFLGINKDGTSYIKADAAMYIDPKVLDEITKGMNAVNEDILSGVLVRDKNTNAITSAKGDKVTSSAKGDKVTTSAKGQITPAATLDGYYVWYWYGFDFVIDAYNCGLAIIDLTNWRNQLLGGGTVSVVLKYTPAIIFCAVEASVYSTWIANCQEGQYTGRGACLSFLGKPSWAQLMWIYAM